MDTTNTFLYRLCLPEIRFKKMIHNNFTKISDIVFAAHSTAPRWTENAKQKSSLKKLQCCLTLSIKSKNTHNAEFSYFKSILLMGYFHGCIEV